MRRVSWLFALVFIGGLVLFALLVPGLFGPLGWGSGSYGWGMAPWVWGGFGFPILALAMFVVCVLMMGGMMMHGRPHAHGWGRAWTSMPAESLSEILQRRYTRGEITKEEYDGIKRDLGL